MDKKTATLTLTDKLRRLNAPQVVINSVYQKKLVDNALACYQVGDIVAVGSYGIRDTLKNKNSNLHEKLEPKANYLFVENIDLDKRVVVSSFAIISEEEVEQLKNTFYNDVPSDVEAAMNTLNIKNYTEIYNKYSSGELNKIIAGYNFYLKFKKSLDELFFTRNSSCTPESFEKYLGKSRSEIIDGLKDVGFEDKPYGWSDIAVPKSTIKGIVKTLETAKYFNLLPGFFNLVFTMPREDQNIEANKIILKVPCDTLDSVSILVNEYYSGKNFQEYFDCLDTDRQKKVISILEFKEADNSVYNSFLWSKGFKTVGLDHLRLYKEDTKGFIEYFNNKSVEERKSIIKDLMNCEATNEEVVNWLTKNHIDLVREVGLSND